MENGKLAWDAKLKDLLPAFAPRSAELKEKATLTDMLSMSSRMERYNGWS